MKHFVVTIERLSGCGGMEYGKLLAGRLSVPLYDRNILRMASDESGIDEKLFGEHDERLKNSLLYKVSKKVYKGELIPPSSNDFTSENNLFNYQAKVLKELSEQESFVAVGRCSDFILKDHPNLLRVFLTADEKSCIDYEMKKYALSEKEAREKISRVNKERAEYYRYYTGRTWSYVGNYDLCINVAKYNKEQVVDIILDCMGKLGIR